MAYHRDDAGLIRAVAVVRDGREGARCQKVKHVLV